MYDMSAKFNTFYKSYVVLPKEKQKELYSKKDINIQRLKDGLDEYNEENGTSYTIVDTCVQGSVAMSTVVQNEDNDYDIDVAIGETPMRIYMNGASLQQCEDMIKYASPIMDNNITEEEVNNTINYIDENKTANGYYYAELGLVLFNRGEDSYEFMLKPKTD